MKSIKIKLSILLLVFLLPLGISAKEAKKGFRAVSLRVLQEKLKISSLNVSNYNRLQTLCGIKRIEGFILEEENNDLIVFGMVEMGDPNAPPLYTEDFVLALRNIWHKYIVEERNINYYSSPGCSIDPDPKILFALDEVSREILSSRSYSNIENKIEQWDRICQAHQDVVVLGIPFNTNFAKVMVEADYYMKRLVNGSVSLNIKGFISLTDLRLQAIKEDIMNKREMSVSHSSMNRFWFCPGQNEYLYDEGIALIEKCQVILLTEAQYLTKEKKTSGTGYADPLAKKFAESFSSKYGEIAAQKSIYLELENLFRFVNLAKIMKEKKVQRSINLDYLLEKYPISDTTVDPTLPGIPYVKEFEHKTDYADGYEVFNAWMPSCGGVLIDISPTLKKFVSNKTVKLLTGLKKNILDLRPNNKALFWDFYLKINQLKRIVSSPSTATAMVYSPKDSESKESKETKYHDEGSSRDSILLERISDDIEASKQLKNALILDLYKDKAGNPHLIMVGPGGNIQKMNIADSTEFSELINTAINTKGSPGKKFLERWENFCRNNLASYFKSPKQISMFNKQIPLKPLLIIKSNEVNYKYANLERISPLTDNFVVFVCSKPSEKEEIAEISAQKMVEKIQSIPKLTKSNIVFVIRPPKRGLTGKYKKLWEKTVKELEDTIGSENVMFNPSKNEFKRKLNKKDKEIVVLELTHTEDAIILKNNKKFTSKDILQGENLSHIKYLIGCNSCSFACLENGDIPAAFRKKGVGIMNVSYSEVSMNTVLRRLRVIIEILKNIDEYKIPTYYLIDIVDSLLNLPKTEKRTIHLGDIDHLEQNIIT